MHHCPRFQDTCLLGFLLTWGLLSVNPVPCALKAAPEAGRSSPPPLLAPVKAPLPSGHYEGPPADLLSRSRPSKQLQTASTFSFGKCYDDILHSARLKRQHTYDNLYQGPHKTVLIHSWGIQSRIERISCASSLALLQDRVTLWQKQHLFVSMIKEGTALMLSCMQGLPSVQGTTIRDVSDPTANQDEQLFCHHVFKFIRIKLSKSPEDVDLLAPRELELNLAEGLDHTLFVLQPGAFGHYHLANVDPGHCALGLSKGAVHQSGVYQLQHKQHPVDADNVEGVEPQWDVKTLGLTEGNITANGTVFSRWNAISNRVKPTCTAAAASQTLCQKPLFNRAVVVFLKVDAYQQARTTSERENWCSNN
ncbi:hypothetical protein MJG53_009242 [Ovis ammon polii x Ovis aries]|uniref:Uncharacterized protein n=1 Tax=Ovis ammon polii x Ovis aries TaxID=2918886 RepID=A0ACB9UVT5_9CETA|nr:hypothetical protein MJG53_009242 [Ovis ammon polii x Ovis aries]